MTLQEYGRFVDYSADIKAAGQLCRLKVSHNVFVVGDLWRRLEEVISKKIQITGRTRHGRSSISRGRLRYDAQRQAN